MSMHGQIVEIVTAIWFSLHRESSSSKVWISLSVTGAGSSSL
jgi:hypothetical protein